LETAASHASPPRQAVLDGVRVLDLSRVVAAPLASQLLGDLGADVIKVERPGVGDDSRAYGPVFAPDRTTGARGASAYYLAFNRNKRGITVDFATPEGAEIVRQLARRCDVVVENYKVGDLARHGLDYATLAQESPGIVYCSVTGYGQDGPYAARGGFDAVFQAQSGFMHAVGIPDGEGASTPHRAPIAAVDLVTGTNAALAIVAALLHRERTGRGQSIDIALLDCAVAFTSYAAQQHLVSGEAPVLGVALGPQEVLECADGPILLLGTRDPQFVRICAVLECPGLAEDARFRTGAQRHAHRSALRGILVPLVRPWQRQALLERLGDAGVIAGAVHSIPEVFADAQVRARGMAVAMPTARDPDLRLVGSPLRLADTPGTVRRAPPGLGEHTDDILRELLGYDHGRIQALRASNVI
jgi:crotonobetainyl-CoA:carnitine CoA-transferase CaiB-like acyl-CoA transferase